MPRGMTEAEMRAFLAHGTRTAKVATVSRSGAPHVMPVWFVLDGEQLVFTTGVESAKGRNLRRDPRVAVAVDDERPPFAFVHIRGRASVSEDLAEQLRYNTEIGARYMGAERAEEFGRRNSGPGGLVVRITPERVISEADVAGALSAAARKHLPPVRPGRVAPSRRNAITKRIGPITPPASSQLVPRPTD